MKRSLTICLIVGDCAGRFFPLQGKSGASGNNNEAVTYTKDVAPLLFAKCATCHHPGEMAPMSLMNFKEVRPWAKSIREKVVSREMPPWYADPNHWSVG